MFTLRTIYEYMFTELNSHEHGFLIKKYNVFIFQFYKNELRKGTSTFYLV